MPVIKSAEGDENPQQKLFQESNSTNTSNEKKRKEKKANLHKKLYRSIVVKSWILFSGIDQTVVVIINTNQLR